MAALTALAVRSGRRPSHDLETKSPPSKEQETLAARGLSSVYIASLSLEEIRLMLVTYVGVA